MTRSFLRENQKTPDPALCGNGINPGLI